MPKNGPAEAKRLMLWTDLPEAERARLIRNEAAQRRETAKRGLPALPCAPEALWLLQRGMCTCNECRGEVALVPGEIVIAHVYFRAGKGSPGHVPANLALWNDACNRREAGLETSALGRGRRMTPKRPSGEAVKADCAAPSPKRRKMQSPGFQKRTGPSSLSSNNRNYVKRKWK